MAVGPPLDPEEPALADPAAVDPAAVDPAAVDPAAVPPTPRQQGARDLAPLDLAPLDRALQAARDEEPADWPGLAATIRERVRALAGPGDPVLVLDDAGREAHDDNGSRTYVSSRVLTGVLRRVLQRPSHAAHDLRLLLDGDRLTGLEIELVASYGQDLLVLGQQVRADLEGALVALLGPDPDFDARTDITVTVVDVVVGDPTLV